MQNRVYLLDYSSIPHRRLSLMAVFIASSVYFSVPFLFLSISFTSCLFSRCRQTPFLLNAFRFLAEVWLKEQGDWYKGDCRLCRLQSMEGSARNRLHQSPLCPFESPACRSVSEAFFIRYVCAARRSLRKFIFSGWYMSSFLCAICAGFPCKVVRMRNLFLCFT